MQENILDVIEKIDTTKTEIAKLEGSHEKLEIFKRVINIAGVSAAVDILDTHDDLDMLMGGDVKQYDASAIIYKLEVVQEGLAKDIVDKVLDFITELIKKITKMFKLIDKSIANEIKALTKVPDDMDSIIRRFGENILVTGIPLAEYEKFFSAFNSLKNYLDGTYERLVLSVSEDTQFIPSAFPLHYFVNIDGAAAKKGGVDFDIDYLPKSNYFKYSIDIYLPDLINLHQLKINKVDDLKDFAELAKKEGDLFDDIKKRLLDLIIIIKKGTKKNVSDTHNISMAQHYVSILNRAIAAHNKLRTNIVVMSKEIRQQLDEKSKQDTSTLKPILNALP